MSTIPIFADENWRLPSRGRVGMFSLIIGESAIFTIFVVAYVYYIGRSTYGPTPRDSRHSHFQYRVPAFEQHHHPAGRAGHRARKRFASSAHGGRSRFCSA